MGACNSATVDSKYGEKAPIAEDSRSVKIKRAQSAKQKVFDELATQAEIPEAVTKMFANVSNVDCKHRSI